MSADGIAEHRLGGHVPPAIRKAAAALLAVALAAGPAAAHAAYPDRPIKIVVGMAPGGTPDVIARLIGEGLSKELGQSVIVDNRPGAGGTLSARQVARAPSDGYTLLLAELPQLATAPLLFKDPGFDISKDFSPVGTVAVTPMFIVANPEKAPGLETLPAIVAKAKASPGEIKYSSSGIGSLHHLAMEVFSAREGIQLTHVPYKGAGQSVPALAAGEVDIGVAALPAVYPYVKTGKLALVASTSNQRLPLAPDVVPVSAKLPGYEFSSELGLIGPANIPRDAVARLSRALETVLGSAHVRERLQGLGSIASWSTPEACAAQLKSNIEKYADAVKLSGIQAN
ncbi:Bug family tripartite tricarboxylate transporter substrate binding protein [Pigmentiphaga humi]|nr:tripartite tricarboxylate transporter substrate-binding protein [Pigmentiphaga humi]